MCHDRGGNATGMACVSRGNVGVSADPIEKEITVVTPATPNVPSGPAIGTLFPDFTLADQHGTPVNFTAARSGKRAMIVVYRSAAW